MMYFLFVLILVLALAVMLLPLAKSSGTRSHKITVAVTVSAIFFIVAFGLYRQVGSPEIIPLLAERQAKLDELKVTIVRDSEAVKKNPKDVKAWARLGQSFMETSQWNAAVNAFRQAVLLSNGNPALIMAYARAQILNDDGNVSDEALKSLKMVLVQRPDNAEAKYFMAVRQLQSGQTQEAMKQMKALYKTLPADSPLKAMIDRQIGRR